MSRRLLSCCNVPLIETKEGECLAEQILERSFTNLMAVLSTLGRLEDVITANASLSTRCWKFLEILIPEVEFNLKKALHLTDSPLVIRKLSLYLERARKVESKSLCFNKCGIIIPCSLCISYPFSQMECPKPLPRSVRELISYHNVEMLKKAFTYNVTPCK